MGSLMDCCISEQKCYNAFSDSVRLLKRKILYKCKTKTDNIQMTRPT